MRWNDQHSWGVGIAAAFGVYLFSGSLLGQPPPAPGASSAPSPAPAASDAAAPQPLSSSLTGMAKAEYESGKILALDKDFANALVKFQSAHSLSKEPRLLWNMAVCEKNLRHYVRARDLIDRYLREGGALLSQADRAEAEPFRSALSAFISTLRVKVSEPSADVYVDDTKVGTSPLPAPVPVDVGKRTIRIKKAGFKELVAAREITGATEMTLVAKLDKEVHEGRVTVEAGSKDLISVDGKIVAQGRWAGALTSGGHSLRVTAPGMVPYQGEVTVQAGQARTIPVTLTPGAPRGDSAALPWIVGGSALLVGAVIGGVILSFQHSATLPVDGTVKPSVSLSFGSGGRR